VVVRRAKNVECRLKTAFAAAVKRKAPNVFAEKEIRKNNNFYNTVHITKFNIKRPSWRRTRPFL
jgi:hypothetical protein